MHPDLLPKRAAFGSDCSARFSVFTRHLVLSRFWFPLMLKAADQTKRGKILLPAASQMGDLMRKVLLTLVDRIVSFQLVDFKTVTNRLFNKCLV